MIIQNWNPHIIGAEHSKLSSFTSVKCFISTLYYSLGSEKDWEKLIEWALHKKAVKRKSIGVTSRLIRHPLENKVFCGRTKKLEMGDRAAWSQSSSWRTLSPPALPGQTAGGHAGLVVPASACSAAAFKYRSPLVSLGFNACLFITHQEETFNGTAAS